MNNMCYFEFMKKILLLSVILFSFSCGQQALSQEKRITSFTLEGGPIASKHLQSGDEDFRERHVMAIAKVHTEGYGNWGLYFLNPNSVDDTSYGFGYVTDPYVVPLGLTDLELSGALGLVTGYQDYPVPLLAAQARLKLIERGAWNVGIAMAASPYYIEEENGNDNEFGVVVTSPFLSARYAF